MISEEEFDLASRTTKEYYVVKFRTTILNWIRDKETEILEVFNKRKYSVGCKSFEASVKERNQLETEISESRERNDGAIDLATLDKVCLWGFRRKFPLRNPNEVIRITRKAFESIDKENYYDGVFELMKIQGVGISRASKIIGLSNQERLCIYDSHVGHALEGLKKNGVKLIKCPPVQGYKWKCDFATDKGWAMNYERLIWTIEAIQNCFKTRNRSLRAADIEIALFVMGEN